MTRGSSAVVIVPKFAAPTTAAGAPNCGVLNRLKISARSSTAFVAIGKRRITARSTCRYDGLRTGLREADPISYCGVTAKALVLNQRAGVRSPAGKVGSPTRFGR